LKVLSANNKFHYNKKNNEKNKAKIIRNNIIKNKGFKNIIIRDKAIASKLTDNQNAYKFKYNNIGNSFDEKIANNNKKTNLIKKRNKSSNIYNFNNRDFLDNITQDNYKKNIYFNFRSNNKKLKTNKSFNIVNKNNNNYSKRVPLPNNKNINNKPNYYNSDSNSNIIINYINEMEKYNKMLMEQKLGNYQKISKEKKNKKNIF
jgi:predicted DNA-binding protein